MRPAAQAGPGLAWLCGVILLAGLAICLATRLATVTVGILNVDEASYAAAAVRALDTGALVLKNSRDNKPPGIVAAYAATFAVFGLYEMPAIRLVGLACVLATAAVLFWYGRRWLGPAAGAGAAGFYLIATSVDLRFLAFKTEILMNLPLSLACCLSLDAMRRPTGSGARGALLLAGLCAALAVLVRQTAALIFVGLWLGIGLHHLRRRPVVGFMPRVGEPAAWCAGGVLLGLALAGSVFWQAGALPELWRQAVEFPRDFSAAQRYEPWLRMARLATYLEEYFRSNQILFGIGVFGLLAGLRPSSGTAPGTAGAAGTEMAWALPGSFIASLLAFAAAPDMYPANFIQLFVPLALAFASGISQFPAGPTHRVAALFIATLCIPALVSAAIAGLKDPLKARLDMAKLDLDHEFDALIKVRATPQDKLFVWGFKPQFYVNSGLPPATRFTLTSLLVGLKGDIGKSEDPAQRHPYYEPDGWRHFMRELDDERPRFIIDALYMANSYTQTPLADYPVLQRYVQAHYRPIARSPDGLTLFERSDTAAPSH